MDSHRFQKSRLIPVNLCILSEFPSPLIRFSSSAVPCREVSGSGRRLNPGKGFPTAAPVIFFETLQSLLIVHRGGLEECVTGVMKPATVRPCPIQFHQQREDSQTSPALRRFEGAVQAGHGISAHRQVTDRHQLVASVDCEFTGRNRSGGGRWTEKILEIPRNPFQKPPLVPFKQGTPDGIDFRVWISTRKSWLRRTIRRWLGDGRYRARSTRRCWSGANRPPHSINARRKKTGPRYHHPAAHNSSIRDGAIDQLMKVSSSGSFTTGPKRIQFRPPSTANHAVAGIPSVPAARPARHRRKPPTR